MIVRLFVVFCLSVPLVFADESVTTAQQWLEKMGQSMKSLNYQGTVAFVKNGRLDTMRYFHQVQNGQEKERLVSLNSPSRDIVREYGNVRCFFKDTKAVVVNHHPTSDSFILNLPVNFSALKDVYHFSFGNDESIATFPVRVVFVKAKDSYRYGRKIWIEKEHFLPLKVEVYDLSGAVLEQIIFTDMHVGQPIPEAYTDKELESIEIKHIHQADILSIDKADIFFDNIPAGFQFVFFTQMDMGKPDQSVDHVLLSDGFSSISVYKEKKTNHAEKSFQSFGAINSFTHSVNDHQITAMGEVPQNTALFVAEGVRFR